VNVEEFVRLLGEEPVIAAIAGALVAGLWSVGNKLVENGQARRRWLREARQHSYADVVLAVERGEEGTASSFARARILAGPTVERRLRDLEEVAGSEATALIVARVAALETAAKDELGIGGLARSRRGLFAWPVLFAGFFYCGLLADSAELAVGAIVSYSLLLRDALEAEATWILWACGFAVPLIALAFIASQGLLPGLAEQAVRWAWLAYPPALLVVSVAALRWRWS